MDDATSYLFQLLPEVILVVGACVVLLARRVPDDAPGVTAPVLTLIALLAALVVTL